MNFCDKAVDRADDFTALDLGFDAGVFQVLYILIFLGGKQFSLGNFEFRFRPQNFLGVRVTRRLAVPGAFGNVPF